MPEVKSVKPPPVALGKRRLGYLVILVVLLVAIWHIHPWVLRKAIRFGATMAAERAGYTLQIGELEADLARPFTATDIELTGKNSATALRLRSARLGFNSLWDILVRHGRIFRDLQIDGLTGVLDFRSAPGHPAPATATAQPAASPDGKQRGPLLPLRLLPIAASGTDVDLQVLGDRQVYDMTGAAFSFSEAELGKFQAKSVSVRVGTVGITCSPVQAITAWKDGSVYLASLTMRPDIVINNLSADLANAGAVSLRVDAQIFGGMLSGDARIGQSGGEPYIDGAAWASNVDLSPLSTLPDLHGTITGLLREGRLTFRGNPGRAAQGEASLRVVADDFHWNYRGWKSLEIAASMIHSRLAVTQFDLKQKDNILSVSGEVSTDKGWAAISHSPLQLNITGSINQIGELAGLLGDPFNEMTGRMSLNGTLNGQADDLNGYVNMEASQARFRSLPVDSVRLESVFRHNEAQITRLEVWSGKDSVTGDGSISLTAPHHYSGEFNMAVKNIATYLAPFRAPKAESIYSGALGVQWQGDGTFSASSGAFDVKLRDFVSVATPAGMTGHFVGTYAPQNIYLGTLELSHGPLRFFTHASAAAVGITLKDTELDSGKDPVARGEVYFPINVFALAQGKPWREAVPADHEIYGQVVSSKDISLKDLLQLAGRDEKVEGTLSGNVSASNTLTEPHMDGSISLRDGSIPAFARFPGATGIEAYMRLEGQTAYIDKAQGQMAGGFFQVGGNVSFKNLGDPDYNLTFNGSKILLAHHAGMRLVGDMDFTASGNNEAGQIGGSVHFTGISPAGRPKLTLFPAPAVTAEKPGPTPPDMSFIPKPFSDWKLGVSVGAETPVAFGGGTITPDLKLEGIAGKPVPVGQINLGHIGVDLPHGTLLVSSGTITFLERDPWEPILDIPMDASLGNLYIRALAHGRLDDRKLRIDSNLPLTEDELLFFINTGIASDINSAVRLDELATGLDDTPFLSLLPFHTGSPEITPGGRLFRDQSPNGFDVTYSLQLQ